LSTKSNTAIGRTRSRSDARQSQRVRRKQSDGEPPDSKGMDSAPAGDTVRKDTERVVSPVFPMPSTHRVDYVKTSDAAGVSPDATCGIPIWRPWQLKIVVFDGGWHFCKRECPPYRHSYRKIPTHRRAVIIFPDLSDARGGVGFAARDGLGLEPCCPIVTTTPNAMRVDQSPSATQIGTKASSLRGLRLAARGRVPRHGRPLTPGPGSAARDRYGDCGCLSPHVCDSGPDTSRPRYKNTSRYKNTTR